MLYEGFAQKQQEAVLSNGGDPSRIRTHVFQALQYLRKVCNHPKLVLHPQHEQVPILQKVQILICT
jgi:TATA-binding protein-associated factor